MNNFNDGAPIKPIDYLNLGCEITPCKEKVPFIKHWSTHKADQGDFKPGYNIGLKMTGLKDLDADNHFVKRYVSKYLLSPGSSFGRKSNPCSHYIYAGETKPKKYTMPKEFEEYCKGFPHGVTLLEIRSGNTHQTIAPGSSINNEKVEWNHWVGFQEYVGDFERDVSKIALSVALTILYPLEGKRDDYCTAIAGILSNHTNWSANEIDVFVYNLALLSGKDPDANERMAKGTNAKNDKTKNFGFPKLAEVVGCSVSTLAKLFEWVGIKNASSLFDGLRVHDTEPKMWELKYKDSWIPIYDTSYLLSYTKIKILIMENCMEEPPELKPNDWKTIRVELLKNVEHIKAPIESSYYGIIGGTIVNWLENRCSVLAEDNTDLKFRLGSYDATSKFDGYYWFKLEALITQLKRKTLSFEMRKLTHFLRNEFGAESTKITIDKKELRVWKIAIDRIENHVRNNKDTKGALKVREQMWDKREQKYGSRYKDDIPY